MIVSHLGQETSSRLSTLAERDPVRAAANRFADNRVGLLVVCGEHGEATGVVSKSDLVRYLAHQGSSAARVADIMTREIVACLPNHLVMEAWVKMRSRRRQNMPVLKSDLSPVGVLDVRDALQALLTEEQAQERLLIDYIAGVGYR